MQFKVITEEHNTPITQVISAGSSVVNDKGRKVKATFRCIFCGDGIARGDYIDSEADKGQMSVMPLAIVAEGVHGRVYLDFDEVQAHIAVERASQILSDPFIRDKLPTEPARGTFASNAQGRIYGFKTFADYFTARQLVMLVTFGDLVSEARELVRRDAIATGLLSDDATLGEHRTSATAYANAVATWPLH